MITVPHFGDLGFSISLPRVKLPGGGLNRRKAKRFGWSQMTPGNPVRGKKAHWNQLTSFQANPFKKMSFQGLGDEGSVF